MCAVVHNEYHLFLSVLKVNAGQRMGWGVHYDPNARNKEDFCDKNDQLALCYVTLDDTLVFTKILSQPEGGWYPLIALHPYGKSVGLQEYQVRQTLAS